MSHRLQVVLTVLTGALHLNHTSVNSMRSRENTRFDRRGMVCTFGNEQCRNNLIVQIESIYNGVNNLQVNLEPDLPGLF